MATQKHIKLTGTSKISWKDAIVKTVESASKTISNITNITIIEKTASIENDKILEYFVTLDLIFTVDENVKN